MVRGGVVCRGFFPDPEDCGGDVLFPRVANGLKRIGRCPGCADARGRYRGMRTALSHQGVSQDEEESGELNQFDGAGHTRYCVEPMIAMNEMDR